MARPNKLARSWTMGPSRKDTENYKPAVVDHNMIARKKIADLEYQREIKSLENEKL